MTLVIGNSIITLKPPPSALRGPYPSAVQTNGLMRDGKAQAIAAAGAIARFANAHECLE
jgi:hypothetical protein